eukprot:scaffold4876_cov177-Amphora_coffeaeformis.AAC.4
MGTPGWNGHRAKTLSAVFGMLRCEGFVLRDLFHVNSAALTTDLLQIFSMLCVVSRKFIRKS